MATTCDRQLRRCVNLPRRQHLHAKRAFRCSAPAVWNSLPKTVLSGDSVAVFKSMGDSSFPRLSLISLLTNMLPGPSASEVTTSWRNTNLFIIIIIFTARCYASAVLAMALCLSVRSSVCPSVTSRCCTKTAKRRIT